jgi:hypothetical protein
MKIAIIGGGAAGMMAAATLIEADPSLEVHLFEKNNKLGTKVRISGGGRCNVTTGIRDRKLLLTKYVRGADFLKTALGKFSPKACYQWFEERGVPLKNESDNRVFPVSDNGDDIVGIFENLPIKTHLQESVSNIQPGFKVTTNKQEYDFDTVIITTGGNAFAHTGSTGDGYHFAKNLGHTITKLGPSLNSFETEEQWPKDLSGLALENAKLNDQQGPFLFTHFGISGPVTFAYSATIAFKDMPQEVNFAPTNLTFDQANQQLTETLSQNGAKQVHNVLHFTPKRLTETLLKLSQIDPETKCAELSKDQRKTLAKNLTGDLVLTLKKRRPGDEFVTAGGVNIAEVDPKTMQSRIAPNLYFAGEILDIDGVTGGFNLQSSWATGRLAANAILNGMTP